MNPNLISAGDYCGCDTFFDHVKYPHRPMTQEELQITADLEVRLLEHYDTLRKAAENHLSQAKAEVDAVAVQLEANPRWQELSTSTDGPDHGDYRRRNEEKKALEVPLEAAKKRVVRATNAVDDVDNERIAALLQLGFLAGQVNGFRHGIKLMTMLQAGRLDRLPGIDPDGLEARLRGAILDDDLATGLLAALVGVDATAVPVPEDGDSE